MNKITKTAVKGAKEAVKIGFNEGANSVSLNFMKGINIASQLQ